MTSELDKISAYFQEAARVWTVNPELVVSREFFALWEDAQKPVPFVLPKDFVELCDCPLELVEDGIKVNSICPGNFFDGPLWSNPENGLFVQYLRTGKVAGAKTIEDVKQAYEAKVPMGRGCTVQDVMRTIYYVIEQPYETGQAIPVTGGQLMK